jgi:hypothetical protein
MGVEIHELEIKLFPPTVSRLGARLSAKYTCRRRSSFPSGGAQGKQPFKKFPRGQAESAVTRGRRMPLR